jgi:hypothetical protein
MSWAGAPIMSEGTLVDPTGWERLGVTFEVTHIDAADAVPSGALSDIEPAAFLSNGLSLLFQVGLVASLALFMPAMRDDDSEVLHRDRILTLQHLLNAQAEREPPVQGDDMRDDSGNTEGGTGQAAAGRPGHMGSEQAATSSVRLAIQGDAENRDPHVAREVALREAAEFGMIGLLNAGGAQPDAPTAPWGRVSTGNEPMSARGNMWGDAIGDSFGCGCLMWQLTGTGEGGGGRGEGIGFGEIGTIGRGLGTGIGGGVGMGHGHLEGGHTPGPPILRLGATTVNGRLPPETIQRIVRQNFGRFRLCYTEGLLRNPTLEGRVAVKFVIARDGSVETSADGGSDLPDTTVTECVVRAFGGLSFPTPEGGIVTVSYPITFSPTS